MLINATKSHQKRTTRLQAKVRARTQKLSLCSSKKPSNTLRNKPFKQKSENIDLSKFDRILSLDCINKRVTVGSRITVGKLTKLLLEHNLMLPVVPEFNSITVGGAIMGSALESSSHRFGQFNDICLEYELILGDGTLIKASPKENGELFYALSGSYGTLALLTSVTLQLIDAKKYVHLTYTRYWDHPHLVHHLRRANKNDFIEGILFDKSWAVAIEGRLTNQRNKLPINRQNKLYRPWYYQHTINVTKKGDHEEVMPLKDYLFRFNRGAFWMGKFITRFSLIAQIIFRFKLKSIAEKVKKMSRHLKATEGPNFWIRSLFNPFLTSKSLYKIWHKVPNSISESLFFIQDFYTPLSQTENMLNKCMDSTQIFPIWLCPLKNCKQGQFLSPHYNEERLINIGLYGIPKINVPVPLLTEKLEKELHKAGGKKMLYSYTYYDEKLFANIYDKISYDKLREKYKANEAFPLLYNKVTNKS